MGDVNEQVSPYIKNIRNWKIREIINGYFDALLLFKKFYRPPGKIEKMTYSTLRKICDILYEAKENFHLIFKRVLNPKKKFFEQANKFTPNDLEINFMNVIGILFHRVMVAREMKYLMDYYEENTENYDEAKSSLERNMKKIDFFFNQGVEIIHQLLEKYQDNILLLTYFLENAETLKSVAKINLETFFANFEDHKKIEELYLEAGKYYFESGWKEKTRSILKELMKIIPNPKEAIEFLKQIKGN